jgi:hypothetical protein
MLSAAIVARVMESNSAADVNARDAASRGQHPPPMRRQHRDHPQGAVWRGDSLGRPSDPLGAGLDLIREKDGYRQQKRWPRK